MEKQIKNSDEIGDQGEQAKTEITFIRSIPTEILEKLRERK